MNPLDLVETARELVNAGTGKPRQSNLRRAVSTAYYALFHLLAQTCADTLAGPGLPTADSHIWRHVYRALDHKLARDACRNTSFFSQDVRNFASLFITMQSKRHEADYDPFVRYYKFEVSAYIDQVEAAILSFQAVAIRHRKLFVSWVLFKRR